MAHCSTVLSQVLKYVPRHEFQTLSQQVDSKRRSDAFSRWDQFVTLSAAQLSGRASLRDIEQSLNCQKHLHYHHGSRLPSKSALARANQNLSADFYQQLFRRLYARCASSVQTRRAFKLKGKLFSLDASLIEVSLKLFPQANYNTMKAAYKLHLGLDHEGMIPAFATLTAGKVSDMDQARVMAFPKGSTVVFDKGYNDYTWHNTLTLQGVHFVTRIRGNALYDVVATRALPTNSAVLSDELIRYTGQRVKNRGLKPVRLVRYYDHGTDKHYAFITNNLEWSAQTVADIYKQRWQVELFFKWIKQNLKIKAFIGHSENAVRTQVLIALCTYLILSFIKFQSRTRHSLQQLLRLIHLNLFARRSLLTLIHPPNRAEHPPPQLVLI